jgi:hypothetical protein
VTTLTICRDQCRTIGTWAAFVIQPLRDCFGRRNLAVRNAAAPASRVQESQEQQGGNQRGAGTHESESVQDPSSTPTPLTDTDRRGRAMLMAAAAAVRAGAPVPKGSPASEVHVAVVVQEAPELAETSTGAAEIPVRTMFGPQSHGYSRVNNAETG